MNLSEYIAQRGRGAVSEIAHAIDGHASDVCNWASRKKPVPVARCVQIERATAGMVTRKELRPDDWQSIWPELASDSDETAAEVAA